MFYVEVCIPHGDLGILTTLCPLQQFSLFISLQHRMTCTNSHCNFNLTCICIYFRFGSAISLNRSQTGWKYVYCSRKCILFSVHTDLFSAETEWSNRRHSLPQEFSVDDLQLNYNTYNNNNRLWYKVDASKFVPVICFFFCLLFFCFILHLRLHIC